MNMLFSSQIMPIKKIPFDLNLVSTPEFMSFTGEYGWQEDATRVLESNSISQLVSPTGSGKTPIIQAAAISRAMRGGKSLVITPQTLIVDAFGHLKMIRSGKKYDDVFHKFIASHGGEDGSVEKLIEWLETPQKTAAGRCGAATIATFVRAWKRLSRKTKEALAKDGAWFVFDEDQHSGLAEEENAGTYLGDIIHEAISLGIAVAGVSATNFRSDKLPLFHGDIKFEKWSVENPTGNLYRREYIDHWNFTGYESLKYNCVNYEEDPLECVVGCIRAKPKECHIVCVSANGYRYRKDPTWCTRFKEALSEFRVLDLVDPNQKDTNKKILVRANEQYKRTGEFPYDIILSCNIMREGVDLIRASRVHDLAPSESTGRIVQTIGRLTRKDPWGNVRDIAYAAYLDSICTAYDPDTLQKRVSDRVNVGLVALITAEDYFNPPELKGKSKNEEEYGKEVFGDRWSEVDMEFTMALHTAHYKVGEEELTFNKVMSEVISKFPELTSLDKKRSARNILKHRFARYYKIAVESNNDPENDEENLDAKSKKGIVVGNRLYSSSEELDELRRQFDIVKRLLANLFQAKTTEGEIVDLTKILASFKRKDRDRTSRIQAYQEKHGIGGTVEHKRALRRELGRGQSAGLNNRIAEKSY